MSLTSEQVKREMGYDTSKDKAMMNEPRNINIGGALKNEEKLSERPADQPLLPSS